MSALYRNDNTRTITRKKTGISLYASLSCVYVFQISLLIRVAYIKGVVDFIVEVLSGVWAEGAREHCEFYNGNTGTKQKITAEQGNTKHKWLNFARKQWSKRCRGLCVPA